MPSIRHWLATKLRVTSYFDAIATQQCQRRNPPCFFSSQVTTGLQIHLIGPNGAGKSTLLASLAGLLPASGEIVLAGKSLQHYEGHELARQRAYLSQQQSALSLMPVSNIFLFINPPVLIHRLWQQRLAISVISCV